MYLQNRKSLDFLCLSKGIVWTKNCFYMQYNNKYRHIKEQIWEMLWPKTIPLSFLSATNDLNISGSPRVETVGLSLYCSGSASSTFLWLSHVGVRRTFWTMAECTWPHAKRKVNCLALATEWKWGCIVLPTIPRGSFHMLSQHFNSLHIWKSLLFLVLCCVFFDTV